MATKVISDEELMLLLSPICQTTANELQKKPKLTMKLLYELIKKLKEENMILTDRLTEYEHKIDLLLDSKSEVAASLALPLLEERGTAIEISSQPISVPPSSYLVPRSIRHPEKKKTPMWFLFVKSSVRFLFRRRRGVLF
ncbi:hypothetical protein [Paenibacillus qinlingensis]|uniref:Uncharacterized protein n=1 Tax=Paenibacillus qinlingensis TaxID=1837343 RepID=A0ABU1NRF7_9BACL|nr:hypothetical protein [Paenibacillus qinlingensis]MDR6550034.1 hypothetical protein [Paenibacillus qinlingensis]